MQVADWKPDMHESCSRYWAEIYQQEAKAKESVQPVVPENTANKGGQTILDDGEDEDSDFSECPPTESETDGDDDHDQVELTKVPTEPPMGSTAPLEDAVPRMHAGAIWWIRS